MIIKTKEFQEVCKTIALALDSNIASLELKTKNNILFLSITNQEYYCTIKFNLDIPTAEFRAVVDANLFLNLVSGITADTFELVISGTNLNIKVGKSSYKLALIYNNDELLKITPIIINNKSVEMPISNDILKSILNINSKELLKVKNIDTTELQRLYYIDETGCFTFTTGACLNRFTLEKPVKMLLNDRIVKLFKLFKTDVLFSLGHDIIKNTVQTKVTFETDNIYLAALINCDDNLLAKIQGPCTATKNFIDTKYDNNLVLSANSLLNAISRLLLFTKNSNSKANMRQLPAKFIIKETELEIYDNLENVEVVPFSSGSYAQDDYTMILNLTELKLILESYKDEFITLNCGNHRSVIINQGTVSNLISEWN